MKNKKGSNVPNNQSSSAQGANNTAAQNDARANGNMAKPTLKK